MARNLIGYFGGGSGCSMFSVQIIANSGSNEFEEIYLDGDSPFVVTYDTSETPFDPIRYSRASINVVADEKFLDVFSPEAQGTKVILTNTDTNTIEWVGYLVSRLYNMPQDSCGYETFTLEAQDCLMTLEKYDYHTIGTKKSIVTFRQILGQIAEKCGLITDMYIDGSLMRSNGTYIEMGALKVSEQNFFSSDTDEPWKLSEVLEELCRYLGYTATQYKTSLYLYDMQSHSSQTWNTSGDTTLSMNGYKYQKSSSWTAYTQGSFTNLAKGVTLRQPIIRGTDSDISLETIYNKVQVKDSFYQIDHFLPDIFDDNLLTNRDGNFWTSKSITNTGQKKYINKKGKSVKEEKDERENIYYMRKFNHRDYSSIYRDPNTLSEATVSNKVVIVQSVDQNEVDNNYSSHSGVYTVKATFKNRDSRTHTIVVGAQLTYDWYDDAEQEPVSESNSETSSSVSIPSGETRQITVQVRTDHSDIYTSYPSYGSYYVIDGTDIYDLNINADNTTDYVGATIVDLATFDKPMNVMKYNYETESDISFDRYIMIHQADQPDRCHPKWRWDLNTMSLAPLNDSQIEAEYPAIFELNNGYVNPMIIDDKAYVAINAEAIYERYDLEYINPDWTKENSNTGSLGLFSPPTTGTLTVVPCLIFKLKVGNKYWSSGGWTTTDSCFCVNLGTDKTDSNETDYTAWWNTPHPAINNIDWSDWAGVSGYKIPLDPTLDFTQDIKFWIMMPSKLQAIETTLPYDGVNNYCWVKKLDFTFATKESLKYDIADILYENVISSGSVNTLADVTMRLTTYPSQGAHSYSSVALDGTLLTKMKKVGLDDVANVPEENVVKVYTNQYHTPTIKQTLTLQSYISPFSIIKDPTLDNRYFGVLGTTIDFANDSQTMTLIEMKPWDTNLD